VTAVVAGVASACKPEEAARAAQATPPLPTGGTMGPHDTTSAADAMDELHEKGVKAFPAKTAGKGNQLLKPRLDGDVKVFELNAKKIQWEVEPGRMIEAWAYNEQIPGPQIRVREGDRVRIVLDNQLPESTAVHFHGLEIPNDQDGVPFITQPPIKPGEKYTYEFTVPNAGSHMYHSHHNAAKQVGLGLLGAFVVEPKQKSANDDLPVDYVMILNDGAHGYTLNGKSFPATEPVVAKLGQKIRIRYMNEGMMIHPMHLHGMHQTVIAKDGWDLPMPYRCDTLNIAPGERYDVIVNCNNPGTWAFHCHILPHAESQHGMFGMVTALVVQK
jgi:FtsP/CotA-like multicopper oxidase with cupredoxin domain